MYSPFMTYLSEILFTTLEVQLVDESTFLNLFLHSRDLITKFSF